MTQRQVINHKSDNLLVLIGSTKLLPEIILKFRHLNIGEVIYKSNNILVELSHCCTDHLFLLIFLLQINPLYILFSNRHAYGCELDYLN
jgi:hypothetical protein